MSNINIQFYQNWKDVGKSIKENNNKFELSGNSNPKSFEQFVGCKIIQAVCGKNQNGQVARAEFEYTKNLLPKCRTGHNKMTIEETPPMARRIRAATRMNNAGLFNSRSMPMRGQRIPRQRSVYVPGALNCFEYNFPDSTEPSDDQDDFEFPFDSLLTLVNNDSKTTKKTNATDGSKVGTENCCFLNDITTIKLNKTKGVKSEKFVSIAAMYSEVILLTDTGRLVQWKWNEDKPYTVLRDGKPEYSYQKCEQYKITDVEFVSIDAQHIRLSALTKDNKVLTLMDTCMPRDFSKFYEHSSVDPTCGSNTSVIKICVSTLYTAALDNENNITLWSDSRLVTNNSDSSKRKLKRGHDDFMTRLNKKFKEPFVVNQLVRMKKVPIYQKGSMCFRISPGEVPQCFKVIEDIWTESNSYRFQKVDSNGKGIEDITEWFVKDLVFLESTRSSSPVGKIIKIDNDACIVKFDKKQKTAFLDKSDIERSLDQDVVESDAVNALKGCRVINMTELVVVDDVTGIGNTDIDMADSNDGKSTDSLELNTYDTMAKCIHQFSIQKIDQHEYKHHSIIIDESVSILSSDGTCFYIFCFNCKTLQMEKKITLCYPYNSIIGTNRVNITLKKVEGTFYIIDGNGCFVSVLQNNTGGTTSPLSDILLPFDCVDSRALDKGGIKEIYMTLSVFHYDKWIPSILRSDFKEIGKMLDALINLKEEDLINEISSMMNERVSGNLNLLHVLARIVAPVSEEEDKNRVKYHFYFNDCINYNPQVKAEGVRASVEADKELEMVNNLVSGVVSRWDRGSCSSSFTRSKRKGPLSTAFKLTSVNVKSRKVVNASILEVIMRYFIRIYGKYSKVDESIKKIFTHVSASNFTPFGYCVKLKSYNSAILLFQVSRKLFQKTDSTTFYNCLGFDYVNTDNLHIQPMYVLLSNNMCTFSWTHRVHQNQDIYSCKTCDFDTDNCCCTECVVSCHAGHDVELKARNQSAYCDCVNNSKCNATILGNQNHRYDLFKLLLEDPIIPYMCTPNNECLVVFSLKLFSRKLSEYRRFVMNTKKESGDKFKTVITMPLVLGFILKAVGKLISDIKSVKLAFSSNSLDSCVYIIINVSNLFIFSLFQTLMYQERKQFTNKVIARFIHSVIRVYTVLSLQNTTKCKIVPKLHIFYKEMQREEQEVGKYAFQLIPNIELNRLRCEEILKSFPDASFEYLLKSACRVISPIIMGVPSPSTCRTLDVETCINVDINEELFDFTQQQIDVNEADADQQAIEPENPYIGMAYELPMIFANAEAGRIPTRMTVNNGNYLETEWEDVEPLSIDERRFVFSSVRPGNTSTTASQTRHHRMVGNMLAATLDNNVGTDINITNTDERDEIVWARRRSVPMVDPMDANMRMIISSSSDADSINDEIDVDSKSAFRHMLDLYSECCKHKKSLRKNNGMNKSSAETDKSLASCFTAYISLLASFLQLDPSSWDVYPNFEEWKKLKETIHVHLKPVWNWVTPLLDTLENQINHIAIEMYKRKNSKRECNNIFAENVGLSSVHSSRQNFRHFDINSNRFIYESEMRKNTFQHVLSLLKFDSSDSKKIYPNANVGNLCHAAIILDGLMYLRRAIYEYETNRFVSPRRVSLEKPKYLTEENFLFFNKSSELNPFIEICSDEIDFNKSIDESLPLVKQQHQLSEFTVFEDIFSNIQEKFKNSPQQILDMIKNIETVNESNISHSILNRVLAIPLFVSEKTPILNEYLAKRWHKSLLFFAREIESTKGVIFKSILKNLGGFAIAENRFLKDVKTNGFGSEQELVLKVAREPHALLESAFKQLSQISKFLTYESGNFVISRFRVTFSNEPGEGSGVSRSFFPVFVEALTCETSFQTMLKSMTFSAIMSYYAGISRVTKSEATKLTLEYETCDLFSKIEGGVCKTQEEHNSVLFVERTKNPDSYRFKKFHYYYKIDSYFFKTGFCQKVYDSVYKRHKEFSTKVTLMLLKACVECCDTAKLPFMRMLFDDQIKSCLTIILKETNPSDIEKTIYLDTFGHFTKAIDVNLCLKRAFYESDLNGFFVPQQTDDMFIHSYVFKNVGFLLGVALQQGEMFPLKLARPIVKFLLGKRIAWHDFAYYDAENFESLRSIIVNRKKSKFLENLNIVFNIQLSAGEGGQLVDLVENGSNIAVSKKNVFDYVKLYAMEKMINCRFSVLEALKEGLNTVVSQRSLNILTPEYFRLMSCGISEIDVSRLKRITKIVNETSYDKQRIHDYMTLFWSVVDGMTQENKHKLIYFWMSRPQLPATTKCLNPLPSINIRPLDDSHLPTANTCVARLYIPLYSNKKILLSKLSMAIQIKTFGFV